MANPLYPQAVEGGIDLGLGPFVGFRVRRQPQTIHPIITGTKIPSATLSGMVLSVAYTIAA
jgi:hypothetical protein